MTSKVQGLAERSEVPVELTWDLSAIFSTEEDCRKAQLKLEKQAGDFKEKYQGKIKNCQESDFLLQAIKDLEALYFQADRLAAYVSLAFSVDMRNPHLAKWMQEVDQVLAQVFAESSFFDPELAQLDDAFLAETSRATEDYSQFLKDKLAAKSHLLQAETERVLAALEPSLQLPYKLYDVIKGQDMEFPDFEANGQSYPLSFVSYENNYARDKSTEVRRQAFKSFCQGLNRYHKTNASILISKFTTQEKLAKLRGFANATEEALFQQKSNRSLYDRQIDLIMSDLAPHMQRYAGLLADRYQLDRVHYSDLLAPFMPDFEPEITISQAETYIDKAMDIMGPSYKAMIMAAFPERWLDFAQNLGKSTGGFCADVAGCHPYILLNWSGNLSEVFTLAHELGHAGQNILASRNNSFLEREMPFYLVEAPSTAHELLLADSLFKQNSDPDFQDYVTASLVGNTYYHNAVTHLLEGAFQREVMDRIAAGDQLGAEDLDAIFLDQLKAFWGDRVILDPGAEKTWMRQPHYYAPLYSYTYSASLVVSTAFYLGLQDEPQEQVAKWQNFLKTGGPLPVIEHAKLAGVDLSTDKPLRQMIAYIGRLIGRLDH